jgi:hypothetical protein
MRRRRKTTRRIVSRTERPPVRRVSFRRTNPRRHHRRHSASCQCFDSLLLSRLLRNKTKKSVFWKKKSQSRISWKVGTQKETKPPINKNKKGTSRVSVQQRPRMCSSTKPRSPSVHYVVAPASTAVQHELISRLRRSCCNIV